MDFKLDKGFSYCYDIVLDKLGVRLDIYNSEVKTEVNSKGKLVSYRTFDILFSGYPENLALDIQLLREADAFSITDVENDSFTGLVCKNPLVDLKVHKFKRKNKILQKIYEERVVDSMCIIYLFVLMINTSTGALKIVPMGNLGLTSEAKEEKLKEHGYEHITDTCLMNYLDAIEKNKPIRLERIK